MQKYTYFREMVPIPGPGHQQIQLEADTPTTLKNMLYILRDDVNLAIRRVEDAIKEAEDARLRQAR